MFLFEYARCECLHRISFQNRHSTLRDDWTTIKRLVNEVDSASTHFHSMLERLTLCIKPGESRQQARMNVEYSFFERLDEAGRQEAHVSRQAYKIHFMLA